MTATVTPPRCSYCYMLRGREHAAFCERPGKAAEDAAEQTRVRVALMSAPRCATCGTLLVKGACLVDWCPSTAMTRAAVDAGESVGTAIGWAIRVWRVMFAGLLLFVVGRVMGWW